jgi:Apea-like HEPN
MTYTFHNRFTTFNERVNIDAGMYELADTDRERVILLAGSRETMIKDTGDLVVEGSRYPDEATAIAAARQWRRVLTVAFARTHVGTSFGIDDSADPPAFDVIVEDPPEDWRQIGIQPGDRVVRDEHRLLVVTSEPRPKFLLIQLHGVVRRGIEQFESNLNDARAYGNQEWSAEKIFAHRLVTYAIRDTNPETQHIQLVTAIEVLLRQQDRPQAVLDALKRITAEVKQYPADEDGVRKRLLEILHEDREESISRAARDQLSAVLTGPYHGTTLKAFFRRVYDMRSRLLHRKRHENEMRPTTVELGEVHFELLRLVLDFLDASE